MWKSRRLMTALLAAYWLSMFVVTHLPGPVIPEGPVGSDKLIHGAAYWLLAVLLAARRWIIGVYRGRDWLLLLPVITAYAALDEVSQMIPAIHRHADWWDGLADVLGASLGLAMFHGLIGSRRRDCSGFGDIYESDQSSA